MYAELAVDYRIICNVYIFDLRVTEILEWFQVIKSCLDVGGGD